jgi:hypothetical protein
MRRGRPLKLWGYTILFHRVRGSPFLETRCEANRAVQEQSMQSHHYSDGRGPLARLFAHHTHPGTGVDRALWEATGSATTVDSRSVGFPSDIYTSLVRHSTNCFSFKRMMSDQRKYRQKEEYFNYALKFCKRVLDSKHPKTITTPKNYAVMLRQSRHNAKADELERRIKSIEAKLAQEQSATTE